MRAVSSARVARGRSRSDHVAALGVDTRVRHPQLGQRPLWRPAARRRHHPGSGGRARHPRRPQVGVGSSHPRPRPSSTTPPPLRNPPPTARSKGCPIADGTEPPGPRSAPGRAPSAPSPQESESNGAMSARSRGLSPGDDGSPRPPCRPSRGSSSADWALKFLMRTVVQSMERYARSTERTPGKTMAQRRAGPR